MSENPMIPTWAHSFLNRLGLGLASLLLVFGLAEWVCRLARNASGGPLDGEDRPPVFYHIDKGRECLAGVADEDLFRIAVIGDSFTVGVGVQSRDRYAAHLEQMLNAREGLRPVKVRLFAFAGTSTYQQLRWLKSARKWNPDVVILAICLNDTEDWDHPGPLKEWREAMVPRRPGPVLGALLKHSALLSAVYRAIAVQAANRGYVRYYRKIYDPEYSGWKLFRVSIKRFKALCGSQDIPLVVAILPLMTDCFEKGRYRFEFAHEAIRTLLDEQHIAHLDLLESFRGKNPVRMMAIPVIDPHPSEIAHRIIAESMLDYLLRDGFLPRNYRPVESGAGVVLRERWRHTGQLMNLEAGSVPRGGPWGRQGGGRKE